MENVPAEIMLYVGVLVGALCSFIFTATITFVFAHPVSWFGVRNVEKRIKYLKAEIYRLNKDLKDSGFGNDKEN